MENRMGNKKICLWYILILICATQCFAIDAIGPLNGDYGFKGYFYKYHGATLTYWIRYPDPNNYNPNVEHPVIVYQPGSYNCCNGPGHQSVIQYPNYLSQIADTCDCFIIVPEPTQWDGEDYGDINILRWPDYGSPYRTKIYQDPVLGAVYDSNGIGWIGVGAWLACQQQYFYMDHYFDGPDGWFLRAFCSLIKDFGKENFTFYTKSDFSDTNLLASPVNINYDKIYYIGFSWGCLASSSYLTAGRDLFDGAILIDEGQTFAALQGFGDKEELSEKLASRYSHIPVVVTSGTDPNAHYTYAKYHFERLHAVDANYNNKYFIVGNGWSHNGSGYRVLDSESLRWRFDISNHDEQLCEQRDEVDGYILSPIKWLMQQNGLPKEQIPPDPYPNESYWDDNVHNSVPNKSEHLYQYLHHNSWAKALGDKVNYYEIIDTNTEAILLIGDKEIKVKLEDDGNLIWDKGGVFEHTFTGNDQSYIYDDPNISRIRVVTNAGGYNDNQQFEVAYSLTNGVHNVTADRWYDLIQDAIFDSSNGDVIEVYPGVYYESLSFNQFYPQFRVFNCTIRSTNPDDWNIVYSTVIYGSTVFRYGTASQLIGLRMTGGGIRYQEGATAVLKNCIITGNTGDAVSCDASTPTIMNCIIRDNAGIGIVGQYIALTARNNVINNNSGGIKVSGPYTGATLWNNTIVNNTNFGIKITGSVNTSISNNILRNDGNDLNGCTSTYSWLTSDGNPGFVPGDLLFHIDIHSPCVNKGNPAGDYSGQTDIDGENRWNGSYVDIGADEVELPAADAHQWGLDESSGSIAFDSVGDTDGTFNGSDPCWIDGLIGGAIDCNGVSDYVSVAALDTAYNPGSTFTVAGWFKTSKTTGIQTIAGQWNQYGFSPAPNVYITQYFGWQILVENNKVVARFGHGGTSPSDITGTSTVNNGLWHHFALVYPTMNSNAVLYVDGYQQGTPGPKICAVNNTKFRIGDGNSVTGVNPVPKGGPFCGMIDDVMIYNRALTTQEVLQLYEIGAFEVTVPAAVDAHQWGLDEVSGTTAEDLVGDSNGIFNGSDPCWISGFIGGAIECNGVSDYFSVPNLDTAYNPGSTFSVAGWFKTSQTTGTQTIVGQWNHNVFSPASGVYLTQYYGWQILVENNKVVARFGQGGTCPSDITGTSTVSNGKWHHFVLVYPTINSNAVLYVDGFPQGYPEQKICAINNTKFRIGDGSYATGINPIMMGGPFCGLIDEIMIFNRALAAEEVLQLYESGL